MQVTENHLKSMIDLVNDTATAALIENVRQNFAEVPIDYYDYDYDYDYDL